MDKFDIIEEIYERVLEQSKDGSHPEYLLDITKSWRDGTWRMYTLVLDRAEYSFEGKVVLDFGCKYGHILPMFLALGASEAIGVDAEEVYVEPGAKFFSSIYPNIQIKQTMKGLIPLQPDSVDFVLINEVISHVNYEYLDTVYREIARVLRPGGVVLISDGNNFGNIKYRQGMASFWDKWENGPDGVSTDRDTVGECYLSRRRRIIRSRVPEMSDSQVDILASNTSGLFGKTFEEAIDGYNRGEELIRRPYLTGLVPVNPAPSGVLIERGFHPLQVIADLADVNIQGCQVFPTPPSKWENRGNPWNDIVDFIKWRLWGKESERIRELFTPDEWRGGSESFMVRGVKLDLASTN